METPESLLPSSCSPEHRPFSTVTEWLVALENRHTQEIQLGLDRIRKVASTLDLLTPQATVITVAGTNGKGSTVAALEAIYHAAGYQVACYTSPHLISFNERIRINQTTISDEALIEGFEIIENARQNVPLTYFEVTTLVALWYFKKHALDLIILEVGLGGRLDATNIIDADLAIITTIDLDHQAFLGTTRESIGREKAGVLRENQSFIFADTSPPKSILDAVAHLNCTPYFYGKDYSYQTHKLLYEAQNGYIKMPDETQNRSFQAHEMPCQLQSDVLQAHPSFQEDEASFEKERERFFHEQSIPPCFVFLSHPQKPCPALKTAAPFRQLTISPLKLHPKAMAAALQASLILNEILPLRLENLQESLKGLYVSGRLEWIPGPITTLLDVSHNPQAAHHLAEHLKQQQWTGTIHAIFSALEDKDLRGLILPLLPYVRHWYTACLSGKRAASREQLLDAFKTYGIINFCFENPRVAYEDIYRRAAPGDLILVYGSFHTVASVYSTVYRHPMLNTTKGVKVSTRNR